MLAINPALDAVRRALESHSITDICVWSNAIAAVLVASMGVIKKPWYHAAITLIVASLFGSFIISSALLLR